MSEAGSAERDYGSRMAQYGVAPKELVATSAADPTATWLDVRSADEQNQAPLPKVRARRAQCPVSMNDANDLVATAAQLLPDKDAPVICFCAIGGRASVAKSALEAVGYSNVINAGGLSDIETLASSLTAEGRLEALGIELPELVPVGRYVPYRLVGNMLYVSGSSARPRVIGKIPDDVSFDEAKAAARSTGISLLSIVKGAIGSLDGVKRVVKSLGMVNGVPDFDNHPAVIDGYAELMTEVFGEDGWGARSAVGMGSLPLGITVEIEAIFEVEDGYGEPTDAHISSPDGSMLELLANSNQRVAALENRVQELEEFVDNMVEEVQARFNVIKAKL